MSKKLGSKRISGSDSEKPQKPAVLHRCSFFPYQPSAINQIAATPTGCFPQVAVIRASEPTSVEIYTPSSDWAVEKIISCNAGENFECSVFVGQPVGENENDRSMDTSDDDEIDIRSALAKGTKSVQDEIEFLSTDNSKINNKHILPLNISSKMPRARLFTAGVDGRLREWSNDSANQPESREIFSVDVNGGAIWSLAISPDQKTLAVGCEDGRVRLFAIYERSVEFLRGFEASEPSGQSARIISLSWNPQGSALISGSAAGSIRLWNCQTGRPVHSVKSAGNVSINCVAFCDSQTFVSGDAKGQIQIWDASSGTVIQSFPSAFAADVLSLTCLPGKIFATGVDHKIVEFVQVCAPNAVGHLTDKWIQGAKRYVHTHDVRSITNIAIKYEKDGKYYERSVLISGGVDCTLVVSDPLAFDRALEKDKAFAAHHRRILPFTRHRPIIQMARNAPILAGKIGNTMQLWKLADEKSQKPIHLADIKLSRYEAIKTFAISPDARLICILTASEVRIFAFDHESGALRKLENLPGIRMAKKATFPHLAAFLDEESLLLINSCEVLHLRINDDIVQNETFNLTFSPRRVSVNNTSDSILLTTDNVVYRLSLSGSKKTIKKLYESPYSITTAAFLADSHTVVLSDCRNGIVKLSGTDFSSVTEIFSELPIEWKIRKEPIMGIQSHPAGNKISCWTDASIYQLTFPEDASSGKRKLKSSSESSGLETRLIDDYRPLLFFSHLPSGSADSVAVERPWVSIVENFPPAFYRPRYGAQ